MCRVHHEKFWAGWSTSWNQDCQEKYQQPQMCRSHHSNGRKRRGTKESLDEGVRGEWKIWLKTQHSENEDHGIWSHHLWQIEWEKVETVTDFVFLGSRFIAGSDCSHEIKRHLLLGRKAMTNLNSILESKDITLPRKVRLIKAMVFPLVIYTCESWTIKKAECQRIDAFKLWCWRRLLRVPWTARRFLKEINPEYSLEGLVLKLKLQSFGHLMQRANSLEKTLMLGKIEGRRREQQRMRYLDVITDSVDISSLTCCIAHDLATEQQ